MADITIKLIGPDLASRKTAAIERHKLLGYAAAGNKIVVDLSVVGPTGSGKTALINDIGLFANANTPSGRRVLINGAETPEEFIADPARNRKIDARARPALA